MVLANGALHHDEPDQGQDSLLAPLPHTCPSTTLHIGLSRQKHYNMRGCPGMAGMDESIVNPAPAVGCGRGFHPLDPPCRHVKRFGQLLNFSLSSNCCIALFDDIALAIIIRAKEGRNSKSMETARSSNYPLFSQCFSKRPPDRNFLPPSLKNRKDFKIGAHTSCTCCTNVS